MNRLSVLLAAAALLTACPGPVPTPTPPDAGQPDGGTTQPPPPDAGVQEPVDPRPSLFKLSGPLEVAPGVTAPAHVRVGVLWFRSLDTAEPRPFAASESGPSLGATLPARWQYDVRAEPPVEARADFTTPGGGAGQVSWGTLVLFRDVDGDGKLTVAQDGASVDELLGSSAGAMPFDADGPGVRSLILWRKGAIGSDEAGVQAGFNLVRMAEPFARPSVFPGTMDLPLRLTSDPRLKLMVCPAAFQPLSESGPLPELACGERVFRTPTVSAIAIRFEEGFTAVSVQVNASTRGIADAKVLLNGVVLPSAGEDTYTLFELVPTVLQAGKNRVRVEAPGLEPLELELFSPLPVSLVQPLANGQLKANETHLVKWTGVEGATRYDVMLSYENQGGEFESSTSTEVSLHVPDVTGPASLTVGVMATTPLARHTVMGTSSVTVPVRLVP